MQGFPTYLYKQESGEHIFTWTDNEGKFYLLSGFGDRSEVVKFMDGILH